MSEQIELYRVTRDDKSKFVGTHNQCFEYILKHQSQSVEWAIKHEGWAIRPEGEQQVYRRIETYRDTPVYFNEFLKNYHAYPNESRAPHIMVPLKNDTIDGLKREIDQVMGAK